MIYLCKFYPLRVLLFLFMTIIILFFFTPTSLLSQESNIVLQQQPSQVSPSSVGLDHFINSLTCWATILGIFVTGVIIASSLNIVNQYIQVRKQGEKLTAELKSQLEKEINDLKEKYNLSTLEKPDMIFEKIRNEFAPQIELHRSIIERNYKELSSLYSDASFQNKTSHEEIRRIIADMKADMKADISKISSKDTILHEINEKYKSALDLQENTLRKVLDAFLKIKNISNEERNAISNELKPDCQKQEGSYD
jgi:hypothetical protein